MEKRRKENRTDGRSHEGFLMDKTDEILAAETLQMRPNTKAVFFTVLLRQLTSVK